MTGWTTRALALVPGPVVFAADTALPEVALTFDDGPAPGPTDAVLEVLARHGAGATFFMIGSRAAERPDLVARTVREGHEPGNHLWEDRPSVLSSSREFERDLLRTQAVLEEAGGRRPVLLRPASGWFRPAMVGLARRHGYRLALGSVTTRDLALRRPERARESLLRHCGPGSVIVVHDVHPPADVLARFTDELLSGLRDRGLRAVTLSALLARARVR